MKRIGIALVVAILAMSAMAAGIGRWSDSADIEGTVEVGSWQVGIADEGAGLLLVPASLPADFVPYDGPNETTTIEWQDSQGTNIYEVTFLGWSNGGLTWHYQITTVAGKCLSHWEIALCAPFVDSDPEGEPTNPKNSPPELYPAIKWDIDNNGCKGGFFAVTFDKVYGVNDDPGVQVLAKAGKGYWTSYIAGPDCIVQPQGNHESTNIEPPIFTCPRDAYQSIKETIHDAVPGFRSWTTVSITNGGSIPVRLRGLATTYYGGMSEGDFSAINSWTATDHWINPETGQDEPVSAGSGATWEELKALLGTPDTPGYQLHAGHWLELYITFSFSSFKDLEWDWSINWDLWLK
ncbi:MAG: hypothetical protein FJZ95_10600 [Chloroflexi bacterium]|nr:hypothetical protein [Chloroflexota bacterium]